MLYCIPPAAAMSWPLWSFLDSDQCSGEGEALSSVTGKEKMTASSAEGHGSTPGDNEGVSKLMFTSGISSLVAGWWPEPPVKGWKSKSNPTIKKKQNFTMQKSKKWFSLVQFSTPLMGWTNFGSLGWLMVWGRCESPIIGVQTWDQMWWRQGQGFKDPGKWSKWYMRQSFCPFVLLSSVQTDMLTKVSE